MNKLLAISIASASIAIGAIPALAEVDPKIHKLCIDAKDYAGCVKAQSGMASGNTNLSSNAKSRTKELKDKLYEFNKRRYIESSPHLAEWVKANPKAARPIIEKEFLFFNQDDYKYSATFSKSYEGDEGRVYGACIKRGKSIDRLFDWEKACSEVADYYDIDKNNEVLREEIAIVREVQEASEIENGKCESSGRTIRRAGYQNVCMSDYEYATYQQQETARKADELYRQQQREQAARDRRSAALGRLADTLKEAGKAWSTPNSTQCYGSSTTYGSTTYGNATCY